MDAASSKMLQLHSWQAQSHKLMETCVDSSYQGLAASVNLDAPYSLQLKIVHSLRNLKHDKFKSTPVVVTRGLGKR